MRRKDSSENAIYSITAFTDAADRKQHHKKQMPLVIVANLFPAYNLQFVLLPLNILIICVMEKLDTGSTLKRLRNRYRLVVMNDDTYEEVVTFKLSRLSVYVLLSTIFVVLVGLTVALIVFTPLKYYIPGYDDLKIGREYRQLKYRTDSLEQQVNYQAKYIDGLKKVLKGDVAMHLDTTKIEVPKQEISND